MQTTYLEELMALQDIGYRDFHSKLMPNVDKERVIGVRTPALRALAKRLYREDPARARSFIKQLPHHYYEENNLHGFLIAQAAGSVAEALDLIDAFLPYVDNWATCDLMPPKIFKKDLPLVRSRIMPWLTVSAEDVQVYRVRFAIVSLLTFFLEDDVFDAEDLSRLAAIHTDEYYINMAIAWYYSFALIKQYEQTIGLFETGQLDLWVHNKSIQKAVESYRIDEEKKAYLRTLRRKK